MQHLATRSLCEFPVLCTLCVGIGIGIDIGIGIGFLGELVSCFKQKVSMVPKHREISAIKSRIYSHVDDIHLSLVFFA